MSNQEAIEIIKSAQAQVEWSYPIDYAVAFDMAISALQEQELQPTCNNLATDTIYRRAAIDALGEEPEVWTGKDEYAQGLNNQWHYDVNALKAVPSAQPDIIRCKDCRWRKDQSGSTAWLPCRAIVTPSDFYCGRAERRTDELGNS